MIFFRFRMDKMLFKTRFYLFRMYNMKILI